MSSEAIGIVIGFIVGLPLTALVWWLLFVAARHTFRDAPPPKDARYLEVEQTYRGLRQQLAAGALTEEDLRGQLKEAMFQDADGIWWMIGHETGEWYAFDGENWAARVPAGRTSSSVPLAETVKIAGRYAGMVFWRVLMVVCAILLPLWLGSLLGVISLAAMNFEATLSYVLLFLVGLGLGIALVVWTIRRALRSKTQKINK